MTVEALGAASPTSVGMMKNPADTPVAQSSPSKVVDSQVITKNDNPDLSAEMIDETVKNLESSIEKLNELMRDGQRMLNFSVEKDLNKVVVKVMDVETEEIIRQFPNEEALKFAKHLEGMMGLLFNEKA